MGCVLCAHSMKYTQRKRAHSKVVRINISLPGILLTECDRICMEKGYTGVSDYVQSSIRRDSPRLQLTPPVVI